MGKSKLTAKAQQELLDALQARFEKNKSHHKSIAWKDVLA